MKAIALHRRRAGVLMRDPAAEAGQKVYFIENAETRRIKIGTAANPEKRLADLQVGNDCELRLIGFVAGGLATESELHRRFAGLRVRGEWFSPSVRVDVDKILAVAPEHQDRLRRANAARVLGAQRAKRVRAEMEQAQRALAAAQAGVIFAKAGMVDEARAALRQAEAR